MRFYYNNDINICAEEPWVAEYLFLEKAVDSIEEAIEELHSKREFYGWFECDVSNTIKAIFV